MVISILSVLLESWPKRALSISRLWHYHELTELEGTLAGVKNYNIAIKKRGEDLVFLRKIIPGGADRSYGIEVAKLAGLPKEVVSRAKKILEELEAGGSYIPPREKIRLLHRIRHVRYVRREG